MLYNMPVSPYLYTCCSVLAARFSNLTKFECLLRRDAITYTHDIFHNECKRPHHATWRIWNLDIENEYHYLTLENKFRLLLIKGVELSILGVTYQHIFATSNLCYQQSSGQPVRRGSWQDAVWHMLRTQQSSGKPVRLGQYHGCWCPGSSRRQVISSHDIDYIE